MPNNYEVNLHNITTIYEELKPLSENNDVIDLTIENIYDNLNINNYLNLLNICSHAKLNVFCGTSGGHLASCICFGKKSIGYLENMNYDFINSSKFSIDNVCITEKFDDFIKLIEDEC